MHFRTLLAASGALLLLGGIASAQVTTGLKLASPTELRGVPLAASPYSGAELPARIDLSADLPPPGDQGHQQSCVGWATAYALKTLEEKRENKWDLVKDGQPDRERVFSPAFIYNQINNGMDGGSSFIDALNLMSSDGAALWSDMPYTDKDFTAPPPEKAKAGAKRFKIDFWRQVNIRDVKEVKAQLNAGYPVLIGATVDEGFEDLRPGDSWKETIGRELGGHAMLVVGYDDSKNAFRIINSWGASWSDAGMGWIDYKHFVRVVNEGYVVKDAGNEPPPTPAPTPAPAPAPAPQPAPGPAPGPGPGPNTPPAPPPVPPPPAPPAPPPPPPPPSPPPPPPPVLKVNQISVTNVVHNVPYGQSYFERQMCISGNLRIAGSSGSAAQIVIHFFFNQNGTKGTPVKGNIGTFATVQGDAATGTPQLNVPGDDYQNTWWACIPYPALQIPSGLMQNRPMITSQLMLEPQLFLDNFGVSTAPAVPFTVSW